MSKTHKKEGKVVKRKSSSSETKKDFTDHADTKDHSSIPKKKKKLKKSDKKDSNLLNKKKHKLTIESVTADKPSSQLMEKAIKLNKKKEKKEKKEKKATLKVLKELEKPPPIIDENPVYPCGVCGKEVNDNDEAILCEAGCTFWYHRHCSGMTNEAYYMLTNEDNAEWVCDKCIATRSVPLVKLKSI